MADKTLTPEERKARAQEFVKATTQRLAGIEESQKKMTEEVTALAKAVGVFKDLDIKKLLNEVEMLKAGQASVIKNIQRGGMSTFNVPGAECLAGKFSLIKAIRSVLSGGKHYGDSEEWALMQEVRKKSAAVIGVDSDGGWFVPDQVIPDVIAAIYTKSVLLDLAGDGQTRVSVIDGLTGGKVRIPKFKSGVIAYWQGEVDESSITKATVGEVNIEPKKLNALTKMSEEQMRFASYGWETLLRRDMVRAISGKIDQAILYGQGNANEPKGVWKFDEKQRYYAETSSTAPPGGTPVGGVLDWTGLSNMDLLIEEADMDMDATFATISSPAYFRYMANLRTLNYSGQAAKDAPYLAGLPPITQARLRDLIGDYGRTTKITSTKSLNSVAKFTDVFRGNWGEVLVGRWSGIEVVTENGYDIINDTRIVKLRLWMDVGCRHEKAIVWCADAQARA